jgi:hypothetical protein
MIHSVPGGSYTWLLPVQENPFTSTGAVEYLRGKKAGIFADCKIVTAVVYELL